MATIREEIKKTKKREFMILQYFLLSAILVTVIGIGVSMQKEGIENARYLLIAAVSLACEGVWGFVLFDCLERRLKN